jgi:glycosyltransferase involved in cell wall biosynthesis
MSSRHHPYLGLRNLFRGGGSEHAHTAALLPPLKKNMTMPFDRDAEGATSTLRKITFLLPLEGTRPTGGFKVAYEYANYLAGKGHCVSVVHAAHAQIDASLQSLGCKGALRSIRHYFRLKQNGRFKPTSWFDMSPSVNLLWVPTLHAKNIPDGDIVIATAWQTAEWAAAYPAEKGSKYYLIQHLETWSGPEDRVLATWKMPLAKIVISPWLADQAAELGESAELIYNGLNFEQFHLTNAIDARDPNNILMSFQDSLEWKGSRDGLKAFQLAQQQVPSLRLTLFGRDAAPADLPADIVYHKDPRQDTLRELYNQASIFLQPSWYEGWGLPACEALQCGASILTTDMEGARVYAIEGETALRSPIKDPEAMAANIVRLVRNPALRLRLATNGHRFIQEFTWKRAGARMEAVLLHAAREAVDIPSESTEACVPQSRMAGRMK